MEDNPEVVRPYHLKFFKGCLPQILTGSWNSNTKTPATFKTPATESFLLEKVSVVRVYRSILLVSQNNYFVFHLLRTSYVV